MRLLSPNSAAPLLDVSPKTVRNWINDGKLEGFRLPGGQLRTSVEAVESLAEQGRLRSKGSPMFSPVAPSRGSVRAHLRALEGKSA